MSVSAGERVTDTRMMDRKKLARLDEALRSATKAARILSEEGFDTACGVHDAVEALRAAGARTRPFTNGEMKMLLLSEIDHAEEAAMSVRANLDRIAREILAIRQGKPVEKHWRFDSYSRRNYIGEYHDEQDNPDWGRGTPIMIVCFYWSYNGGGDHIYVTFPQSWLGQDWSALEQSRVDEERRDEEERERIEELERAGKLEVAERATLERLKKKYEGQEASASASGIHSGRETE